MTVEIDFETRSPVDLRKCGPFVYFEHPEAKVLLGSYTIDGGPVRRWRLGEPMPDDLREAVETGKTVSAHNAAFEILCFEWLARNAGWSMPRYEQFRCTAATAAAMALPRDLKTLGEVLDLDVQKDKDGYRLMRMFSIPDKHGRFKDAADHPAEFEAYHRYCDDDVRTEAEADKRLVPLSEDEQDLWQLSERINRRGVRIDVASARAAIRLADKAAAELNAEMDALTGGAVVVGVLDATRTFSAKVAGVNLTLPPDVAALGGRGSASKGSITAAETVVLTVPPEGEEAPLAVVGAQRAFTAVTLS